MQDVKSILIIISGAGVWRDVYPGNTVMLSANNIIPRSYDGAKESAFVTDYDEQYETPDIWANLVMRERD